MTPNQSSSLKEQSLDVKGIVNTARNDHVGRSAELQLCAKCQEINFEAVFREYASQLGEFGEVLTEHRRDFDFNCELCEAVLSFNRPVFGNSHFGNIKDDGYHLRIFDSARILNLDPRIEGLTPNMAVAVVPGDVPRISGLFDDVNASRFKESISQGLLVPTIRNAEFEKVPEPIKNKHGVYGRLRKQQINFSLISGWITDCQSRTHTSHKRCEDQGGINQTLRLNAIDCNTRDIVPITNTEPYATLSYVWGPVTEDESTINSTSHGRLPGKVPATIEDAIHVVLKLRYRYLWVDRYCIKDDDTKHVSIANMGNIYNNSVLTIVALNGTDSEAGLAGVSFERKGQLTVRTPEGILATAPRHLSQYLSVSKWITRGWTYQEACLSRRCLFFTVDEVIFACREGLQTESLIRSPDCSLGPDADRLDPYLFNINHRTVANNLSYRVPGFALHLSEYSKRDLSYTSDRLNAFRGIMKEVKSASYWGVPLMDIITPIGCIDAKQEMNAQFCRGLTWVCCGPTHSQPAITRRTGFPSWSWASVVGQISLAGNGYNEASPRTSFVQESTKVAIEDGVGKVRDVKELFDQLGHQPPESCQYLRLTGLVTTVYLRRRHTGTLLFAEMSEADDREGNNFSGLVKMQLDEHSIVHLDESADELLPDNVLGNKWDAIRLESQYWMLLRWEGQIAQRMGLIVVRRFGWDFTGKVKTIRIS